MQGCAVAVQRLKETVRSISSATPVRFAIVGYRDHPMRDSKMVHSLKDTTEKKLKELMKLAPTSPFCTATFTEEAYIEMLQ